MHGQGILGADAADHVAEDQCAAVVIHLDGYYLLVNHTGFLGFIGIKMDVTLGSDNTLFDLNFPSRATEGAARSAIQIPRLPDGSGDAQFTGIRQRDLNLGLRTGGPQNGHVHGTLRAYHLNLLHAGKLPGLRKVLLVGQGCTFAEQGLQILLGYMDVMGGSFYHYFHGNILLQNIDYFHHYCTTPTGKFQQQFTFPSAYDKIEKNAARRDDMFHQWTELENACLDCHKCELGATRNHVVFGTGNPKAKVLFVGEGPGENEDLQGEPFVGRGGQLLDKMLAAVDLDRKTNVYITNIVKCRPPHNRDPKPEEQEACINWLRNQFALIRPQILVCLGRIAAMKLIKPDFRITKEHGIFFEKGGILMMATLHPAALLRNPAQKPAAFEDYLKLRQKIDELNCDVAKQQ